MHSFPRVCVWGAVLRRQTVPTAYNPGRPAAGCECVLPPPQQQQVPIHPAGRPHHRRGARLRTLFITTPAAPRGPRFLGLGSPPFDDQGGASLSSCWLSRCRCAALTPGRKGSSRWCIISLLGDSRPAPARRPAPSPLQARQGDWSRVYISQVMRRIPAGGLPVNIYVW